MRHHFIREKYKKGEINLFYIRSEDQIADPLKKVINHD